MKTVNKTSFTLRQKKLRKISLFIKKFECKFIYKAVLCNPVLDPWHFGAGSGSPDLFLLLMDPDPDPTPFFFDVKDFLINCPFSQKSLIFVLKFCVKIYLAGIILVHSTHLWENGKIRIRNRIRNLIRTSDQWIRYVFLGLYELLKATWEAQNPLKENIQHFKPTHFIDFFFFMVVFAWIRI